MSSTACADAYDRHTGRYGSELAPAFLCFASVEPGIQVLDAGCGTGALTAQLVDAVGDSGSWRSIPPRPRTPAGGACPASTSGSGPPRRFRSPTASCPSS